MFTVNDTKLERANNFQTTQIVGEISNECAPNSSTNVLESGSFSLIVLFIHLVAPSGGFSDVFDRFLHSWPTGLDSSLAHHTSANANTPLQCLRVSPRILTRTRATSQLYELTIFFRSFPLSIHLQPLSQAGPIASPFSFTTESDVRDILQREQDHVMSLLSLSPLLAGLFISYANRAATLESTVATC